MGLLNNLTNPLVRFSLRANPTHRATPNPVRAVASTMLVATLAALSLTLLAGCGGGEVHGDARGDEGGGDIALAEMASPPRAHKAGVDFRLESEYGPGERPASPASERVIAETEVIDRAAAPVDRQAHTRRGRYVSRATAERHDAQSGGGVIWVDAGCCAGLDPELPERIAFGMQAVLGEGLPLYVSGSDLRQAARLADRLDALGLQRVYLVTP